MFPPSCSFEGKPHYNLQSDTRVNLHCTDQLQSMAVAICKSINQLRSQHWKCNEWFAVYIWNLIAVLYYTIVVSNLTCLLCTALESSINTNTNEVHCRKEIFPKASTYNGKVTAKMKVIKRQKIRTSSTGAQSSRRRSKDHAIPRCNHQCKNKFVVLSPSYCKRTEYYCANFYLRSYIYGPCRFTFSTTK